MDVSAKSFRLPKAGNIFEECEDRVYPKYLSGRSGKDTLAGKGLVSFAVADGATEGMFSGAWAEILVKAYCRSTDKSAEPYFFLEKAFKDWGLWIQNYLNERKRQNKPIRWFEEPGLEAGAFSTLLGITVTDSEEPGIRKWTAFSAGDCCLFHVRNGTLVFKFPAESSESFGNRPFLIRSKAVLSDKFLESCKTVEGDCVVGDVFYLMTDALACWFLQEHEAGNLPWITLPNFAADVDSFQKWVDGLRDEKRMKNDDVALVCVEVIG